MSSPSSPSAGSVPHIARKVSVGTVCLTGKGEAYGGPSARRRGGRSRNDPASRDVQAKSRVRAPHPVSLLTFPLCLETRRWPVTSQPHLLQKRGESRLGAKAREHRAHVEPSQIGRLLGMGLLQPIECLRAFAEADVHLGEPCRRDVPLLASCLSSSRMLRAVSMSPETAVKIAERRQDFGTASAEANCGLQLSKGFRISRPARYMLPRESTEPCRSFHRDRWSSTALARRRRTARQNSISFPGWS